MIGESIQMARERIQTARSQIMTRNNPGVFSDIRSRVQNLQLLKSNPGILSNMKIGRRIQESISAIRGTRYLSSPRSKKGGEKGVFTDKPAGIKERVIVV